MSTTTTYADADLLAAVESTVRAPSGYDSQPWRFRLAGGAIELRLDERRCPGGPGGRWGAQLSCGAALLNLRLALAVAGPLPVVTIQPSATDPALLARPVPGAPRPMPPGGAALYAAIPAPPPPTASAPTGRAPPASLGTCRRSGRSPAGCAPAAATSRPSRWSPPRRRRARLRRRPGRVGTFASGTTGGDRRHWSDRSRSEGPGMISVPSTATATPASVRTVAAVMSTPASVVPAGHTLDRALRAMVRTGYHHLVVIGPDGSSRGVLTDRMLAAAWASAPGSFERRSVADLLPAEIPLVTHDVSVADAARVMRGTGTDAVVVVDRRGAPVGVVTAADFIDLLAD
ncbi:hypothetical protein GCM10010123_37800 [Pilimelia anulata]|uniref:CBS domain-containing protein n=1 Tax=Pilimelia anulata TaxID=53371 RepID=A0A8J3BFS1_9ACTN|nr:CBS domain-containing protein [Pilimelia anulata]GGK04318.1 hypothetical protein GCM10010123_37800 [Pilimelia anulata]